MAGPFPSSYLDIVRNSGAQLETGIQHGKLKPVFLWHLILFTIVPLSALLIPRRKATRYVRPLFLVLVFRLAIAAIRYRRAQLGANGYMIGLMSAWWFIWSATLLLFNDAERDFLRIERKSMESGKTADVPSKRPAQNGNGHAPYKDKLHDAILAKDNATPHAEFLVWQPYPHALPKRLNWALGLVYNMRGTEWNWRLPGLDPVPLSVDSQLKSGTQSRRFQPLRKACTQWPDARTCVRTAATDCLKYALLLDVIKVLMMHDRYFWGITHEHTTTPFSSDQILLASTRYLYRFVLTGLGVHVAVVFVTLFNPLIFLGLSLAFPNASRSLTAAPLDAPWLYPDMFGPFLTPIINDGLAGAWGVWWHQLFRFGFVSAGTWLVSFLPAHLSANRFVKRLALTLTAFTLSGLVHACGSYTQIRDTDPISGTMIFFLLQFVGITLQESLSRFVVPGLSRFTSKKAPSDKPLPRWLCRSANASFAFLWLFLTGRFIMDDFARGGLWLTEPLPVSPLRGLGLGPGVPGEGFWVWRQPWFQYWDGGSFWERGIRVL
ncbi:membrane bound O-acyl transferase family-domain-containing protein [Aspergillus avenaceus]|uniref:Membrane bound O-acyl transferase family-domain-containing protein n=1 Tax=Aspergillus avenaceus TaxID=36643 RepID=A0A5N6TWF2_ASPAV|nr:membrane bound O-acyl transferase family-domain-containing protein [Aspergillus avenaceus]